MNTKALNKKLKPILPRKFIYCDVGARWGISEPWNFFSEILKTISFEPDEEEYNILKNSIDSDNDVFQNALYKNTTPLSLNLTKSRGCSSIYEPNFDFLK